MGPLGWGRSSLIWYLSIIWEWGRLVGAVLPSLGTLVLYGNGATWFGAVLPSLGTLVSWGVSAITTYLVP